MKGVSLLGIRPQQETDVQTERRYQPDVEQQYDDQVPLSSLDVSHVEPQHSGLDGAPRVSEDLAVVGQTLDVVQLEAGARQAGAGAGVSGGPAALPSVEAEEQVGLLQHSRLRHDGLAMTRVLRPPVHILLVAPTHVFTASYVSVV